MPLTNALCASAKPTLKPYKLYDEDGLYLHILTNGKKYWRYKYTINGKERTVALGKYPEISLQDARTERLNQSRNVHKGLDPIVLKQESKILATYSNSQTFQLIAEEWHERTKSSWTVRHANSIMYRLEKYLFLKIGHMPVSSLTPQILLITLQSVENISPDIARRIIQYCKRIFEYAVVTGRLDKDLTFGLSSVMKKPKRGHFPSIEVDELPALLKAMSADKEVSFRQTNLAIRLMLLTFVRTRELLEAEWGEINFETAMWIIPAERMKMRKQHLVPLSKQALQILYELKELNGNRTHIFPSIPYPKKPISNGTILKALERMGYKHKMTGHGFRALAMGVIKEKLDYRHEIVDRQLAHVARSDTDRAYDRAKFLPQRIEMMQRYADYIDSLTQPKPSKGNNDRATSYNTFSYGLSTNTGSIKDDGRYKLINPIQGYTIGQVSQAPQDQCEAKRLETGRGKTVH